MPWLLLSFLVFATSAAADTAWQLRVPRTPFDYLGPSDVVSYAPLDAATANWSICVAYPHLKDSYWLSVNHGMVEEAARLGVSFRLVEAGGYPNIERQRRQILDCVAEGADALVLGAVAFDALSDTVVEISADIPVIAAVNDIADPGITAKVGVSWTEMGAVSGRYIAQRHPQGSRRVKVAWFPGPQGAGWVRFVEQGFHDAIKDSAVEIAATKYGDTGREIQVLLVEEALEDIADLDYIVGAAPAAEAAVSLLRTRGLRDRIGIVSDYMTHAVYRGIYREKILVAPTDFPVLQGRMAIEFAVRAIEGKLLYRHAGPVIETVRSGEVVPSQMTETLAPTSFIPVFQFTSERER